MLPRTPSQTPQSCTPGSNHHCCASSSHGFLQTDPPGTPNVVRGSSGAEPSQECKAPPNVTARMTGSFLSDDSEDEIFFGPITRRERRLVGVERDFHRRRTILLSSPSNNFQSEDNEGLDENTLLETDSDASSHTTSPNAESTVGSLSPRGSADTLGSQVVQVLLPALARGHAARQTWHRTQQATVAIQCWWRMLRVRRAFLKWRAGLTVLRLRWLNYRATVVLQRWWRSLKLTNTDLSIRIVADRMAPHSEALAKTPEDSPIEPTLHAVPICAVNRALDRSLGSFEKQYLVQRGQTSADPKLSDALPDIFVSNSCRRKDKSPSNIVDQTMTSGQEDGFHHPMDSSESSSTEAICRSPDTNDNSTEEVAAQPISSPPNRRTSSRLSNRVTDAPNEPPATRSAETTLRRGRLTRKAPPRRKLTELSAVEIQRITTRNTQFNEKYNQCPLELVIIHRDIPRPVSPTLDPLMEDETSANDDINDEKEHGSLSASSVPPKMPTLSLEKLFTAQLGRSLDNFSLVNRDDDPTTDSSRRIRWDPHFVTLETTHPEGHILARVKTHRLPRPHHPSILIQRLLYIDDDLNDPELQEHLVYRNRVYHRALQATRDLVTTGESPTDVDPDALVDVTRDLLGKEKAKSTKRRKKIR
ncbi:hypothetical protein IWQ61_000985 [Dispira simplex]|nr:hypothetical protein IWQ61_000985 [Dispira simplex]